MTADPWELAPCPSGHGRVARRAGVQLLPSPSRTYVDDPEPEPLAVHPVGFAAWAALAEEDGPSCP